MVVVWLSSINKKFKRQTFSAFCRHALNVQIFLKMYRSDYAEKQLRIMQQIDEDHTLTQLANAWLNLAVVHNFCQLL